ncbi:hypothetical protein PVAP13_9KG257352 [Panicum virgatum]|uniref:Uncharacterized protein n=1 Tax=Panicum virgatum TaxID=38727 RepID=A0A8T0NT23_PANVG|nr:hypothetical protein PVAP13_9KG257352 [Panicum virgatum]
MVGKFRKKPLQNLEYLSIMFSGIISDESDHWNLMTQNPIIPEETQADFVEDEEEIEESHMAEDNDFVTLTQNNDTVGDEVLEISPSMGNAKRRARTKIAVVIQEQITKIAESASSFTSKKSSEVTVQQIMDLILDCGADYGTDDHYIATELFVKKENRDMFLTLPNKEIMFNWLRRK